MAGEDIAWSELGHGVVLSVPADAAAAGVAEPLAQDVATPEKGAALQRAHSQKWG
jgi:hypothetical protein